MKDGNIYAKKMRNQVIIIDILILLVFSFLSSSIVLYGAYRDQKLRANSLEHSHFSQTYIENKLERQSSQATSEKVKSIQFDAAYAKLGRLALSKCHKGQVANYASILLDCCLKCPLARILPELSQKEVYKYVAQEALVQCNKGKYNTYSKRLLDCVYKYGVPATKIAPGLTQEKILQFTVSAVISQNKRETVSATAAYNTSPMLNKFPPLPRIQPLAVNVRKAKRIPSIILSTTSNHSSTDHPVSSIQKPNLTAAIIPKEKIIESELPDETTIGIPDQISTTSQDQASSENHPLDEHTFVGPSKNPQNDILIQDWFYSSSASEKMERIMLPYAYL